MRTLRVVIIDDDPKVIQRVQGRIRTKFAVKGKYEWRIELNTILVKLETDADGRNLISGSSIDQLSLAWKRTPDIVFMDFGYASSDEIDKLLAIYFSGRDINTEDLNGKFLTAVDLVNAARKRVSGADEAPATRQGLSRFLSHEGRIWLYTLSTKPFLSALGSVNDRERRLQATMTRADVAAIDTMREIYDGGELFPLKYDDQDQAFYAYTVCGLIDTQIATEIYERQLSAAKFLTLARSTGATTTIVLIGAGLGAVGSWLGTVTVDLFREQAGSVAWITMAASAIFAVAVGISLPLLFSWLMLKLLPNSGPDHDPSN